MGEHKVLNDKIEALYWEIERLIWAMVWDIASDARWLLQPDEIFGELSLELVQVCNTYPDKDGLELKSLVIRSLQNRVRDLHKMVYRTHRVAEGAILELEDVVNVPGVDMHPWDIESFMEGLSQDARRLMLEVLWPSERTKYWIDIAIARKRTVSENWSLRMTPLIMERALGWTKTRLRDAWRELERTFSDD